MVFSSCRSSRSRYERGRMCANASILRMCDSFAEQSLVWLSVVSATQAPYLEPRVSTPHADERVHGHESPPQVRGMCTPTTAVVACATGGPSTRLPTASVLRHRLAAASSDGGRWVGCKDNGPFSVCSVGLLRARPVAPLGR